MFSFQPLKDGEYHCCSAKTSAAIRKDKILLKITLRCISGFQSAAAESAASREHRAYVKSLLSAFDYRIRVTDFTEKYPLTALALDRYTSGWRMGRDGDFSFPIRSRCRQSLVINSGKGIYHLESGGCVISQSAVSGEHEGGLSEPGAFVVMGPR